MPPHRQCSIPSVTDLWYQILRAGAARAGCCRTTNRVHRVHLERTACPCMQGIIKYILDMVRDLDPAVQLIHVGTPLPLASTCTSLVLASTNTQYRTYLLLEALSWTFSTRLQYIQPLLRRLLDPASRSLDNFALKGARKIGTPGPQAWSRKYQDLLLTTSPVGTVA